MWTMGILFFSLSYKSKIDLFYFSSLFIFFLFFSHTQVKSMKKNTHGILFIFSILLLPLVHTGTYTCTFVKLHLYKYIIREDTENIPSQFRSRKAITLYKV